MMMIYDEDGPGSGRDFEKWKVLRRVKNAIRNASFPRVSVTLWHVLLLLYHVQTYLLTYLITHTLKTPQCVVYTYM